MLTTVPNLQTALSGPVPDLEQRILDAQPAIEHWFRMQWQEHPSPFYASVDLRNSGFKIAPVDTNLFPGGFNNLNPDFTPLCVQAIQSAIDKICPEARGLLLVPESHTRNPYYLRNVATLSTLLRQAGLTVRIGTLIPEIQAPTPLALDDGRELLLEPLVRTGNRLGVAGFDPCMVLLNNDLSGGVPDILRNLEQAVLPPVEAGWTTRRKSRHFAHYDAVAREFASMLGIDPWRINPLFEHCGKINFRQRQGEECLEGYVSELLADIGARYRDHGIDAKPFVIVKADAGTYGMGIMTVRDASEVRQLNRDQRKKMAVVKEGLEVQEVIVQEGVYTHERLDGANAEPVVYMMDRYVVGGFYRVHQSRGDDQNLNAPGMNFVPLAFSSACSTPDPGARADAAPNRFYAYGVIARLALLAASREIEELTGAPDPD
jgi:glutamate--cysteine ligase